MTTEATVMSMEANCHENGSNQFNYYFFLIQFQSDLSMASDGEEGGQSSHLLSLKWNNHLSNFRMAIASLQEKVSLVLTSSSHK